MRYIWFFFIIIIYLLLITKKTYCQLSFNYSGYFYNIPTFQVIPEFQKLFDTSFNEDNIFTDLTRIRIRPELSMFDGNGRFTIHYELDMLMSSLSIHEMIEPGITNRQAVSLYKRFINDDRFKAAHFIDQLYYKHTFDYFEITIGRQVISWGTGRIWQPTDQFNPINPANYSKFEKDGIDALSSKIFIGNFTDIELVYNIRGKETSGNFGGRFRTNVSEYDLSVMSGYFDKYIILGVDFAGNLFGAGIRGEGMCKVKKNFGESGSVRLVLGLDYQLTPEFYGLVEYQYNGEGTINRSEYLLYFEKIISGEIQNAGKNYFAVLGAYRIHPLITSSLSSITNINDKSGFVTLSSKYSVYEDVNISFGGIFFYGPKLSEYSYYSTSIYGLVEFYF